MRRLLSVVLAAFLAVGTAVAVPAPAQAATCSGVWVIVDYGDLGGASTKCAKDHGTGMKALKSAGFKVTTDGGMVTKINGKPGKPDIQVEYWSYWHATRNADGSFSDWSYSNLGADSYKPTKGNAEGWRYQSLDDGKVKPGVRPPAAEPEPSETPKPEPTKTEKPTPKPTKTATPKPSETAKPKPTKSATPKPTKSPTPTTSPSPTKSATPTASPTPTASATASATPSASPSATESPTAAPTASESAAPSPEPPAGSPSAEPAPVEPDSGSPVAAIVAGIVVVAGGGGAGLWWWLKGRHR